MPKPSTIATRRRRGRRLPARQFVKGSFFNPEEKSSCRFSADAGSKMAPCNSWLIVRKAAPGWPMARRPSIDLMPREFPLLEYLARNVDQVVSRAMLLKHVWDLHFDPMTDVIDVYVGRVRRKIDSGQAYPLIHQFAVSGFACVLLFQGLSSIEWTLRSDYIRLPSLPGLGPGIHESPRRPVPFLVDGRAEPGRARPKR